MNKRFKTAEEEAIYQKGKEILQRLSFYSLPNSPSKSGISADEVRKKSYEPSFQLYDWYWGLRERMDAIELENKIYYTIDLSKDISTDLNGEREKESEISCSLVHFATLRNYINSKANKELVISLGGSNVQLLTNAGEKNSLYYALGIYLDTELNISLEIKMIFDEIQLKVKYRLGYLGSADIDPRDYVKYKDITTVPDTASGALTTGGVVQIKYKED